MYSPVFQADYQDVDSLSFLSRTNYQFQPHLSVGKLSTLYKIVSSHNIVIRTRIRQPDSAEHGDGDRVQQGQELHGDGNDGGQLQCVITVCLSR